MICECDVWNSGCSCGVAASEKRQKKTLAELKKAEENAAASDPDDPLAQAMVDYLKRKLQTDMIKELVPDVDWCNTCKSGYQHVEGCRYCDQCGGFGPDMSADESTVCGCKGCGPSKPPRIKK